MKCKLSACLLLAACAALAQNLSFEVASVKPAGPVNSKSMMERNLGTQVEGLRVDLSFVSLADIVRQAYRLKSYQFSGPQWMSAERYDIHARMSEGATKDQVPEMLQSLLADRFKLTFHRENKEHQILALVVGKGGSKLQEAEPDPPTPAGNAANKTSAPGGGLHMDRKMTMPALCDFLGRFMDRPVVDMTELTATYQVVMDLPLEEMVKMKLNAERAATGNAGSAGAGDAASDPSGGSAMFAAVQQLGLKLEQRKAALDLIVVDHAEKVPTEN